MNNLIFYDNMFKKEEQIKPGLEKGNTIQISD